MLMARRVVCPLKIATVVVMTGATGAAGELDVLGRAWGPQALTTLSMHTE